MVAPERSCGGSWSRERTGFGLIHHWIRVTKRRSWWAPMSPRPISPHARAKPNAHTSRLKMPPEGGSVLFFTLRCSGSRSPRWCVMARVVRFCVVKSSIAELLKTAGAPLDNEARRSFERAYMRSAFIMCFYTLFYCADPPWRPPCDLGEVMRGRRSCGRRCGSCRSDPRRGGWWPHATGRKARRRGGHPSGGPSSRLRRRGLQREPLLHTST